MRKEESTGDMHERARRLIDHELIEGLAPDEHRWLEDHLGVCKDCAAWAASTKETLRALKSVSVALPSGLAASTNLRVREKAAELKQRRAKNLALIAGCAASWIAGVASAPLAWRLCEWLGTTLDLPRIVWVLGFLCWWFVPAVAAGLVILWARTREEREGFDEPLGTGPRSGRW